MTRLIAAFLLAFAGSAVVGALSSGCGPMCECSPTPQSPAPQSPLPVRSFFSVNDAGKDLSSSDPESGTVEVTGNTVVIRYDTGGVHHEVVYDVVGPGQGIATARSEKPPQYVTSPAERRCRAPARPRLRGTRGLAD